MKSREEMVLVKIRNQLDRWKTLFYRIPAFGRYLLVGLGSFATDFTVFSVLTALAGIDPLIANCFSRPLGGLTCFLLNRHWTFRAVGNSPLPIQFTRFWTVFGMSLAISEGLLALFCKALGFPPRPGKLLTEGLIVVFNFLALKHWTFRCSTQE